MPGRRGRPGLLGTVGRTAVIAGTAQATANAVNRKAHEKAAPQQAAPQQAPARLEPPPDDDLATALSRLAELHASGALTPEEFAAAKRRLLA